MVKKACPKCKILTTEKTCPKCKSAKLSTKWKGLLVVLDDESAVVKEMGMNKGEYALRVK